MRSTLFLWLRPRFRVLWISVLFGAPCIAGCHGEHRDRYCKLVTASSSKGAFWTAEKVEETDPPPGIPVCIDITHSGASHGTFMYGERGISVTGTVKRGSLVFNEPVSFESRVALHSTSISVSIESLSLASGVRLHDVQLDYACRLSDVPPPFAADLGGMCSGCCYEHVH